MWGTGASSTQCEGAAPASDWLAWEAGGHAPPSGDGNGFGSRYREDFALLARLGLAHHRLSVEWARLEPEPGRHDDAAVAHYRDVLAAAREAGVSPWVCLHHFTLPRWVAALGAFTSPETRTTFWRRHVDFVAETFGDLVAGWQPVNEPNYYPHGAYGGDGLPPGHRDRTQRALVNEEIQLATAEAAVRLRQTGRPVSSVLALTCFVPLDDEPETAATVERYYATAWTPTLGLFRDGVLRVPGRQPVERADLAAAFDLIGFSYYSNTGVRAGRPVAYPADAPRSALGYGIDASGVGAVIDRLHAEVPAAPLLVAEFGVGTDDDDLRAAYLADGLQAVHEAIGRGVDVRGLFHWTAVDNYEWLHGFDVRFGLIDADRTIKPSAAVLAAEAGGTI